MQTAISKQRLSKSEPSCDCRGCSCQNCTHVVSKINEDSSTSVCNHGTRPKCACSTVKPKREPCQKCSVDEPEPILDPARTRSILKVLKYDKTCSCKVVTRALRADVHRYLGLLERPRPLVTGESLGSPEPPPIDDLPEDPEAPDKN